MSKKSGKKNSFLKIVGTDIAAVLVLLSIPIIGPIPGPGGIPLLLTGLGLLSINHDWAKKWLHYVRKHSQSLREIMFPDLSWAKWAWDTVSALVLGAGFWINLTADWWLLRGLSIGIMAGATTIFMLNRNRIDWLDKKLLHR